MNMVFFVLMLMLTSTVRCLAFDAPQVKLEVEFPREVALYTVVSLDVSFRNLEPKEISLVTFPRAHGLSIEIRDAMSDRLVHKGMVSVSRRSVGEEFVPPTPPTKFAPNEKRLITRVVLGAGWSEGKDLTKPLFAQPGRFKIIFRYPFACRAGNAFVAESDWHEFTVPKPSPEQAKAIQALEKLSTPAFLFEPDEMYWQFLMSSGTDPQTQWNDEIEKFIKNHPNSYWTPFAHLSLAYSYMLWASESHKRPSNLSETKARESAVRHAEAALKFKDFPLSGKAEHVRATFSPKKELPPAINFSKPKSTTASPFTKEFVALQILLGIIGVALVGYLMVLLNRRRRKQTSI